MKLNYFLLAGVAALYGTSALAWEHPVPTSQPLATDGTTEQYLYNVDAQAFLLGANDWETRASVSATMGFKWKVKSTGSSTYAFIDYCLKFNKWLRMFAGGTSSIWVDNNEGDNNASWTITRLSSGNSFQIGNEGKDLEGAVLGTAKDITSDSRCYFYVGSAAATSATTWCSVSPDDYEAYLANLDRYKAAVALGELIAKTEEENPGIDLSAPKAVYNDETSTLEQINAAAEQVLAIAKKFLKDGSDFTSYLTNPNMSQDGGWNGKPTINKDAKCAEKYQGGAFDVYQEVEDAPIGLYEISMQGFYRMGSNDVAFNSFKAGSYEPLAFVYMNDSKTAMNCVFDFAVPTAESASYYGGGTVEKEGNVYPDNMTSAGKAFAKGEYKVSAYGLVANEGDKMRIGVKGNLSIGASWAIFTNFKLTYRAKNESVISKLLAEIEPQLQTEKVIGADVKAEVESLLDAARNAATADEKFNALAKCYTMTTKIDESATIFTNLRKAVADLQAAVKSSRASQATVGEANDLLIVVEDGALGEYTNAEATEAIARINEMIEKLAVVDPSNVTDANPYDLTSAIKDADFTNIKENGSNFGAWTFVKEGTQNGPKYGDPSTACEFWNGNAATMKFSICQTISGLPAGTYEVKADAGNSYNGEAALGNDGRVYLYAQVSGKQVIPSTAVVPQVAVATETANYSVCFTIAEGESVTLGFQTHGALDARWFYCDNFTLTYYGKASEKSATQDNMNTVTLTVSEAGYATYFGTSPFAIPEGLKVYTAALDASKTYLTLNEITGNVPANTPVVVEGEGTHTLIPAEAEAIAAANDLKGTATEIARNADVTTYILANGSDGVAFYPYEGDKITAGKAYLEVAKAAAAPVVRINAVVTAISNIATEAKNHAIFNLNGQRVDGVAQPGLYIVNGKKVLVK